jgi:hypothetical protein
MLGAGLVLVGAMATAGPASAAGRADMEVRAVSASCNATACAATARIVNEGAKRARRARAGFFLSKDGQRISVARTWVPSVAAGRRRGAAASFSLAGIAPGTYRLVACADVTRRVRERKEGNNCRAGTPISVAAATQPSAPVACEPGWRADLCGYIDEGMRTQTWADMADVLTFALLYQHHRTGQSIPSSIAAAIIEPYRTGWDPIAGRAGLQTFRVSGFLSFWVVGPYDGMEWERYPDGLDTVEEFSSWWQTYGTVQWTTRQNAINHSLNGIVQSELAWRNAMDDWKAWDLKLVTAQQYSDATVFAHRTLEDARTAVMRAENAIKP